MSYDALQQCRTAWRQLHDAQSQIDRLRRYARLSPAMKDDLRQWETARRDADATLRRILG